MSWCDFSPSLKVIDSRHPIPQLLPLLILLKLASFTRLSLIPPGRIGTYCRGSRALEDQRKLKITMLLSCARCRRCAALQRWSIYRLSQSADSPFCFRGIYRSRLFWVKVVRHRWQRCAACRGSIWWCRSFWDGCASQIFSQRAQSQKRA